MTRSTPPADGPELPFIFVPDGAPPPRDWMAAHPDWFSIPATLVPRRDAARQMRGALPRRAGSEHSDTADSADFESPASAQLPGEAAAAGAPDTAAALRDFAATRGVLSNPGAVLARLGVLSAAPLPAIRVAELQRRTMSDAPPASAVEREQAVAVTALREAAAAAFARYSRDCSHAVWEVMRRVGNPAEPYRMANDLMAHVRTAGSGWRQATMEQAWKAAQSGQIAIAGLAAPGGMGHVVLMLPGEMKTSGGFGGIPESRILAPRVLSGSYSGYEGAMSNGERTVHDAWTPSARSQVTYWIRE